MDNIKSLEPFFGSWRLGELIGEGSFGKVYKIKRETFGKEQYSALKVIGIPQNDAELKQAYNEGMDDISVTSYFESIVKNVVSEIDMMVRFKGNTNIVSYEDHQIIPNENGIGATILIRMELLKSLNGLMNNASLKTKDVIRLGMDICKALEKCHANHVIHRDIKPENIFANADGDFKLGDFGIARQLEQTMSGLSKKGTYSYMAPEVYLGKAYNAAVDLYSLGIVMYRLLNNNRTPFLPAYPAPISFNEKNDAQNKRMAGEAIPAPVNADTQLSQIILKACAFKPKDRYANPTQMREALTSLVVSEFKISSKIKPGGTSAVPAAVAPVETDDKTESIIIEPTGVIVGKKDVANNTGITSELTDKEKSESIIVTQNKIDEEEKTEGLFDKNNGLICTDDKPDGMFTSPAEGVDKEQPDEQVLGATDVPKTINENYSDKATSANKHKKTWRLIAAIALFVLVIMVGSVAILNSNQGELKLDGETETTYGYNEETLLTEKTSNFDEYFTENTQTTQPMTKQVAQTTILVTQSDNDSIFSIANTKTGGIVYYGRYEQDNNTSNGKEKIAWRVLSVQNEEAFLLSEKILDVTPYGEISAWLNIEFYNAAFSSEEKQRILTSNVKNNDGNNTKDKLFLLSTSEATNPAYGFSADVTELDAARRTQATEYAKSKGLYIIGEDSGWWLRSPGVEPDTLGIAYIDGRVIFEDGSYTGLITSPYGARPALWLNLSS